MAMSVTFIRYYIIRFINYTEKNTYVFLNLFLTLSVKSYLTFDRLLRSWSGHWPYCLWSFKSP